MQAFARQIQTLQQLTETEQDCKQGIHLCNTLAINWKFFFVYRFSAFQPRIYETSRFNEDYFGVRKMICKSLFM